MSDDDYDNRKIPYCFDRVMNKLYVIKDALQRRAFIEAANHTAEAEAMCQTEQDWAYGTDTMLHAMMQFLAQLQSAIAATAQIQAQWVPNQVRAIIKEIDRIVQIQTKLTAGRARCPRPDDIADPLEVQHRARQHKLKDLEFEYNDGK